MLIHWTPTLYNQKKSHRSLHGRRGRTAMACSSGIFGGDPSLRPTPLGAPSATAIRSVCDVTKSHEKSLVGGDWSIPYSSSHHQCEVYMELGLSHKIYEWIMTSISYMGCHPNPIDELHHFSEGVGTPPNR